MLMYIKQRIKDDDDTIMHSVPLPDN